MQTYSYQPKGVCSIEILFDMDDDQILHNVRFVGGCAGNTQGVAALAEGQPAAKVMQTLRGIDCRGRGTSCPDQFAKAIAKALAAVGK